MGRAKEKLLNMWERGYSEADGAICADCVTDFALKCWISDNIYFTKCKFCEAESDEPIAASFDEFIEIVLTGVRFDWNDPAAEGIIYETAEGGWQAQLTHISEILPDYDISDDDSVIHAIIDVVNNVYWIEREYYIGDESHRMRWGWEDFKDFVKHKTRFLFLTPDESTGSAEIPPSAMLAAIGKTVSNELNDVNLISQVKPDTDLFRIRVGCREYSSGADLGSPPVKFANQSNRMSPAGIPMFYGALDVKTARAETLNHGQNAGQIVSIGTFRSTRNLRVLDLADLPSIPSVFNESGHHRIHSLRFLHAFAYDITQPIARDGREHIEYVPTQIVTEYFRRVFRDADAEALDGILYRSSRQDGDRAFVLFCENEQCVESDADSLSMKKLVILVSVAHESV